MNYSRIFLAKKKSIFGEETEDKPAKAGRMQEILKEFMLFERDAKKLSSENTYW